MDTSSLLDALVFDGMTSLPAGLRAFAAPSQRRVEQPAEATSFWHEMHVELRRQAGNERLPLGLRGSLRQLAHRAAARGARAANAAPQFPRRQLREASPARLGDEQLAHARATAARAGVDPEGPLAIVEVRNRPDVLLGACELLISRGLTVVTLGHSLPRALRLHGLVELGAAPDPIVEWSLVSRADLMLCGGWDLQFAGALLGRPTVTLNATDPFRLYPVRANGAYLLRTAIDLSTGRELSLDEQLTDSYFRNLRHHGHREHAADEIAAAVAEVLGEAGGGARSESQAQAAVRVRLSDAGVRLAVSSRYVAAWGPDRGFLGDGRLAQVQAGRLS
jgi:hypothetical protein